MTPEPPELTRSRYFTPEEANALLPELLPFVREAQELMRRGQDLVAEMEREPDPGARDAALHEVKELQGRLRSLLDAITSRGVEVKGIAPALLDFPALRYGSEVYLCWKDGEGTIEWWHPIPTGIAGRQRLADTEAGAWEWCN